MSIKNDSILASRIRSGLLLIIIATGGALAAMAIYGIAAMTAPEGLLAPGETWPEIPLALFIAVLVVLAPATIAYIALTVRDEE